MKYFFLSLFILLISLSVFVPNRAQSVDCSDSSFWNSGIVPCGRNCNNTETTADETKPCTLCHFIVGFNDLINYGFKILVFVALVCLVIAGVMYILSAGNEQMITTAKTFIKQVLYGFGFVLAAWLLIFIVMNYFGVKSDLGIEKTEGWTKFTCSTESVTGTGSSTRYLCQQLDVNGNGTIDSGEQQCVADSSGQYSTLGECLNNCSEFPVSRCGSNNEGVCITGPSCTDLGLRRLGECQDGKLCCGAP